MTLEEKEIENLAGIIYDEFFQTKRSDIRFEKCGDEVRRVWLKIAKEVIKNGYRRAQAIADYVNGGKG